MTCRWSDRNLPGRVLPQCPGPGSPSSGQGRPVPWAALRGICAAGVTGPGTGAPPAPPAPALRLRLPSSRGSSSGSSAQKRQQGCRSRERPSACFLQRCQFGLRKLITVVHRAGCSLPRQHVLGRDGLPWAPCHTHPLAHHPSSNRGGPAGRRLPHRACPPGSAGPWWLAVAARSLARPQKGGFLYARPRSAWTFGSSPSSARFVRAGFLHLSFSQSCVKLGVLKMSTKNPNL